ncbi:hypothetical protein BDZ45DRAFT_85981 [Acephala macrosclerotiorum]|nr:hypothetical protein BDZ45DRAFT_85981 [Acephala macrosclerotiorum]
MASTSDTRAPRGLPTYTKTWHKKACQIISPTRPDNSARGKVVVIIGGGTGIRAAIAKAFAEADARGIVLVGRHEKYLRTSEAAVSSISSPTRVEYAAADITDKKMLEGAGKRIRELRTLS